MALSSAEASLLYEAGELDLCKTRGFAAHEWFEAAWLAEAEGPLRELFQAMAQVGAAMHVWHTKGGTTAGQVAAQRIARRGRTRLRQPGVLDALPPRAPLPAAAILLAGGHGRRAGGPKALKPRDGVPLWRWQCRQLRKVGVASVAAVLHPDAVPPPRNRLRFVRIVRADPDASPFASLQAGLRALGPDVGLGALVLPVDCPCPARDVFVRLAATALVERVRDRPWDAVRPCVGIGTEARRGHPVLLAPATCDRVRQGDPATARLDRLLRALPRVLDAWTDDPAVLANFNMDGVAR